MSESTAGRCRHCMRWRQVRPCSRYGGGNYRRGGRIYRSSICQECAHALLRTTTPGHTTTSRWSIWGLRRAWPEPDSTPAVERVTEIFEAFNVPYGDSEQSAREAIRATLVVDEIATIINESLMGYAPGTTDCVGNGTWNARDDEIDTDTIARELRARLLGEQPT